MKIKQLVIHKSRTISVEGKLGRDAYRKLEVGMVADMDSDDDNSKCFAELSEMVDKGMAYEIDKLNKDAKTIKSESKRELLG